MNYTNTQRKELQDALTAYQQETGASANSLSKYLGIATAYVSYILNGQWHESHEKHMPVGDAAWHKVHMRLRPKTIVVETRNYMAIMSVLVQALKTPTYRLIDAPSGSGKTFLANFIAKKYPNDVFIVSAASGMSGLSFIKMLAGQVNVSTKGSGYDILQAITKQLINRRANSARVPLIILDEWENAAEGGAKYLKNLYDMLEDQVSIIPMAANDYKDHIVKQALKNKTPYPQIKSRFCTRVLSLPALTMDSDYKMFCEMHDLNGHEQQQTLKVYVNDYRQLARSLNELKQYAERNQIEVSQINPDVINQLFAQ